MRKVLSRIIAVALAIVLFSAPATTQAATIMTVEDYGTAKYFVYNPNDLLIVNSFETAALNNNANGGAFYVEAGKQFYTYIHFIMPCSLRVMLYDASNGHMLNYYDFTGDNGAVGAGFPILTSGYYRFVIQAYSTTIVDSYYVSWD